MARYRDFEERPPWGGYDREEGRRGYDRAYGPGRASGERYGRYEDYDRPRRPDFGPPPYERGYDRGYGRDPDSRYQPGPRGRDYDGTYDPDFGRGGGYPPPGLDWRDDRRPDYPRRYDPRYERRPWERGFRDEDFRR